MGAAVGAGAAVAGLAPRPAGIAAGICVGAIAGMIGYAGDDGGGGGVGDGAAGDGAAAAWVVGAGSPAAASSSTRGDGADSGPRSPGTSNCTGGADVNPAVAAS